MPVSISKVNLERIYNHARKTYPEECCGLLVGNLRDDKIVTTMVFEMRNSSLNKRITYKIDPQNYLQVLKKINTKDKILGCYHSHPNLPPKPSFIDLSGALPGFTYLIVSLDEKEITDTKCWTYIDADVEFVEKELLKNHKNPINHLGLSNSRRSPELSDFRDAKKTKPILS